MTDRDALYVRSISVERLYGIALRGLHCEDLSPAINVVYGPNAQGKTSLGLAVHGLIWPETLRGLRPSVRGSFVLGEQDFNVEIDGTGARYQRNGLDTSGPTVPEAVHRNRYWLPLHKLLQTEDRDFAEIIRRIALGGIDIEGAAEELGFETPSTRPKGTTRAVGQAFTKVRQIEDQQRAVHEEEEGLAALRHDLTQAIDAEQRVLLYDLAIVHAEARREEQAARHLLEQMPASIENAREDDAAQLRQLRIDIAEASERRETAERRLKDFTRRRDANQVVLSGNLSSPIAKLEQQHSVLANLESGLTENRRAAARALAIEQDTWTRVAGVVDLEQAERIDVKSISSVDEFIEEVETLRAEEKGFEALHRILGDDDADTIERELRGRQEAVAALREWLRAEQETGRKVSTARVVSIVLAIVFAVGAVALAYFALLLAAGIAGGAALMFVILWVALPRSVRAVKPPEDLLERRGIEEPAHWRPADVAERLEAIEDESSDLRLRLRSAQRRDALAPGLDEVRERRRALDERRAEISKEIGIEPPLREVQIRLFLDSLAVWQKARADRLAAEAHLEAGERLADDIRADINANIAPFGVETIGTAAEAKAVIDEIGDAYRELSELQRDIERETLNLETATSAESGAQKRVDAIFARLKLDSDAGDDVVVRLSEQLESYRERHQELVVKQQRLADARRRLEARAPDVSDLYDVPEDVLRNERAAAETIASGKDGLLKQIASVETRIGELRRQHNLEAATADYEAALDDLEGDFEQAADKAVGQLLANHLIDRARDDQLPAVFVRARGLFHRISHGNYRLELDRREGAFYAVDTVRERGFQLDELSTGTKVQLLLSVRIAFVEEQELGSKLPIVLDEALAISDDDRAQAIVETLLTLAREGRQIFYFTAQHDEVAKWKRALEDVDHRLIPLGPTAGPDEIDLTAVPATEFGPSVPPPDGADRRAYREMIGVPHWSAKMAVGELHLWYLVEDVDQLHELLRRGFAFWGQVAAVARDGALETTGLHQGTFARLAVKAAALEAWQKCWRIGRGHRLDRHALADCPAVSSTFLDRVAEVCAEGEGDGATLIRRLRDGAVTGFRTNKMDELEQYLIDNGHIDREDRLTDDEIRQRVASHIFEDLDRCGLTLGDIDRFFADMRDELHAAED